MKCRRKARAERERGAYAARRHLTSEVVTRTVTELRAQIQQDEAHMRAAQMPLVEARIDGLRAAHAAMLDGELGARFAFRQSLLDVAAVAVQAAAALPRPTAKLQSDQRGRVSA